MTVVTVILQALDRPGSVTGHVACLGGAGKGLCWVCGLTDVRLEDRGHVLDRLAAGQPGQPLRFAPPSRTCSHVAVRRERGCAPWVGADDRGGDRGLGAMSVHGKE